MSRPPPLALAPRLEIANGTAVRLHDVGHRRPAARAGRASPSPERPAVPVARHLGIRVPGDEELDVLLGPRAGLRSAVPVLEFPLDHVAQGPARPPSGRAPFPPRCHRRSAPSPAECHARERYAPARRAGPCRYPAAGGLRGRRPRTRGASPVGRAGAAGHGRGRSRPAHRPRTRRGRSCAASSSSSKCGVRVASARTTSSSPGPSRRISTG